MRLLRLLEPRSIGGRGVAALLAAAVVGLAAGFAVHAVAGSGSCICPAPAPLWRVLLANYIVMVVVAGVSAAWGLLGASASVAVVGAVAGYVLACSLGSLCVVVPVLEEAGYSLAAYAGASRRLRFLLYAALVLLAAGVIEVRGGVGR